VSGGAIRHQAKTRPTSSEPQYTNAKTSTDTPEIVARTSQRTNLVEMLSAKFNSPPVPSPETQAKQIREAIESGKNDWRTPINFYGKVVDESNTPVSAANVHFIWTDLSPTGNSEQTAVSDQNGLFSLNSVTGKNLIVEVSKAGYYAYQPAGAAFNYAGENQNFVPDFGNPVVFQLRKKGDGAELVHFKKNFPVPKGGTPILVDLATGSISASSKDALRVECWTSDSEKKSGWKFEWKCRVSVPGGGLQIYDEIFPFTAPKDGYVADEIIDMTATDDPKWSQDVRRKFYVKVADGRFARMEFRMVAHGEHFCQIDSFFNPSGSDNLEPAQ
jgi:hypothetical protein